MKKIIFRAPAQTASGYGVHSRMLIKSLLDDGRFDITLISVPWGATPLIYENNSLMQKISELGQKFNPSAPNQYDASFQVTIPNEFMKMAPKNICITAGIETDRVPALWQVKTNEVADVLVVPSIHSARSFTQGIYGSDKGPEQLLLRKPLYILPEWVDTSVFNTQHTDDIFDIQRKYDFPAKFNFIAVGLGMDKAEGEDRKNLTLLVKWFCEQFKGNQDVGLVLKVSMVNNSPVDFKNIAGRIKMIKAQAGCGQFPRIHLIHGRLGDGELAALYKHPKIKAMVSLTHGEGFGLPLIEAAACGLPVVATNWSGHLDFLRINGKNRFVPVECDLAPIPQGAVWKDVLEQGTAWANPKEQDAKLKMAKIVLSYDKPKEWATELAAHIANTFNESLGKKWASDMHDIIDGQPIRRFTNTLVKKHIHIPTKHLDNVTLVAVDTRSGLDGYGALRESLEQGITFGDVILVTAIPFDEHFKQDGLSGIRNVVIEPFQNIQDHDAWVMKKLADHIETDFFLTVQPDGYILNGSAWEDEFLQYDLIGAPWFWDRVVGNMAFCIRSTRLAKELQSAEYPETFPMDVNICRKYREALEKKGFKWAPHEVAARFSVENQPYEGQFGWHGENPFCGDR
jgi:hypothetical protein